MIASFMAAVLVGALKCVVCVAVISWGVESGLHKWERNRR